MKTRLLITALAIVSAASPVEAGWIELPAHASPPTARHEACYVGLGDRMYLMGGRGLLPTEVYDPAADAWTTGSPPPIELHHFQGLAYRGLIYVIGAMTGGFPGEDPVESVLVYDPVTDTWFEGPEIPPARQRGEAGAQVVGDLVYVVGGQLDGHVSGTVGWTDTFDPRSGVWHALPADMPHPRDHFQLVRHGDALYAMGGRTTTIDDGAFYDDTIAEVDVFDLVSQSWSVLADDVPTQRAGTAAARLGDMVVLIGGESAAHVVAHDETEAYDVVTGMWQTLAPLNRGRHGTAAVVYLDQIYVASGSGNRGGGPELTSQECYAIGADCVTPAPVEVSELSAPVSAIDFGEVGVGVTSEVPLTLTNAGEPGDPSLTIEDAFVIGRDHYVFDVEAGEATLAPGDTTTVTVAFSPAAFVSYGTGSATYGELSSAALAVAYTGGRGALTVPLAGTGIFTVGVPPAPAPRLSLRVAPNPVRGALHATLLLEARAEIHVALYGSDGRLAAQLHEGALPAGPNAMSWPAPAGLPPGVYFLRAAARGRAPTIAKVVLVD